MCREIGKRVTVEHVWGRDRVLCPSCMISVTVEVKGEKRSAVVPKH